jgi:hypothetical protein
MILISIKSLASTVWKLSTTRSTQSIFIQPMSRNISLSPVEI